MKKLVLKVIVVLVLLLAIAVPVLVRAGGWAVLTLDEWPAEVVANEPLPISFVVRQHGQHPNSGLSPKITAVHSVSGDSFTVSAVAAQEPGRYQATLVFPQSGEWQWSIEAFNPRYVMPPLSVQAPVATAVTAPVISSAAASSQVPELLPLLGVAALLGALGAMFAWWRTQARWALALAVVAVLGGGGALLAWSAQSGTAVAQGQPVSATAPLAPAELGEKLFVAKGCVTCHQHGQVETEADSLAFGPDLTHYNASPEFLHTWLKDPAAVRPATMMPNLELKAYEIDALIAFLNTGSAPADK